MAVVQISRVQVRRGKATNGTGVPQLASGEMGWAIDTQELFIGNGSIAEGAPYVGNTKILTEHDNILDLVGTYEYKGGTLQTGPTIGQPVTRTFQQRLDDEVNVRGFGTVADGVYNSSTDTYTYTTDDTAAIQRAIDQLFLNDANEGSPASRVALNMAPGIYVISDSIKVPPYAVIRGAGKDKTIIVQTGDFPVFETVGSTEETLVGYTTLSSMTSLNQPRQIEIYGLTLRTTTGAMPALVLNATTNSTFVDVKLQGSWEMGDALVETDSCLQIKARSTIVTSKDNLFVNCEFVNSSYAINSGYDIVANEFENCLFENLGEGLLLGKDVNSSIDGRAVGPSLTRITNSKFYDIAQRGINLHKGTGNLSQGNVFVRVGNDGGTSETAVYSVIHFGQGGNFSDNDYFERSVESASKSNFATSPYISEISGVGRSNHKYNVEVAMLTRSNPNSTLLRLPGNASSRVKVHYLYQSPTTGGNNLVRQGTLSVSIIKTTQYNTVNITDEYDYVGNQANAEKLSFSAVLADLTNPTDNNSETVFIQYTNDVAFESGYINYWYEILS